MKKSKIIFLVVFAFSTFSLSKAQVRDILKAVKSGSVKTQSVEASGSFSQNNGTVEVTGVDHVKTIKMNGGLLKITGSDNEITVRGYASAIDIIGTDNIVVIDTVNKVVIHGADNQVKYRNSKNKNGRPSVSVTGVDSGAIRIK